VDDPSRRRSPGSWPRDRPIRWGGVAGGLLWFIVSWASLIGQLLLAVPMLAIARDLGLLGAVIALVWAGVTLFTAWSWVLGRWRVVLGPILFGLALVLVSSLEV
jgi:fatty acid desaturase